MTYFYFLSFIHRINKLTNKVITFTWLQGSCICVVKGNELRMHK